MTIAPRRGTCMYCGHNHDEILIRPSPENMEWISVKDRLPDDAGLFLCATGSGAVLLHTYNKEDGWRSISGKDPDYWNMVTTHWMPLPAPPAMKEET